MPPAIGIYVLAELPGPAGDRIAEIQRRYDPKLAAASRPHVTLVGSSGLGSIAADTPVERLRDALAPIAETTAPMRLTFAPAHRYMQTEIVVLPLDPHGPLRELHERIGRGPGLKFGRSRFAFSPHATLSYYPTLTPQSARELLQMRVDDPADIARLQVYLTRDPLPARKLLELELTGA
jgi:2'-5' RNA ligase